MYIFELSYEIFLTTNYRLEKEKNHNSVQIQISKMCSPSVNAQLKSRKYIPMFFFTSSIRTRNLL